MKLPAVAFLLSSLATSTLAASDSSRLNENTPCVARSPSSGLYFDLRAISLFPPELKNGERIDQDARNESWYCKGHDYAANFSINVCEPVIEELTEVVGVDPSRWKNISAYYEQDGEIYSLGESASDPFFRGRKLVLNYTNGSPCPSDYDATASNSSLRRKSAIMSFLCDRDAVPNQATPSFVGTMDSCSYFFEIRSSAACGGIALNPSTGGLGPAGVFGVIILIAVAAYLIGGCAYQRTVMHQRGWRQCPNFSLWAGILDFVKDIVVIIFSSLANLLHISRSPSRSGYVRADTGTRGGFIGAIGGRGGPGHRSEVDAENRLIDQLDEEWDD
ncbi:hypothetical protein N7474_006117 [Penicillium riverlandense]|uniref:uncharacterized protein n=1 Tax=Penicillium riverlandense TaxID=1903569 RepID=UPI002548E9D1|nr:uncharacterized protein N7474_006117 [Penicillium riverlandense]KAJ5820526.1 hypothetical protein N7474_006117 [Penicillium riverlandense]